MMKNYKMVGKINLYDLLVISDSDYDTYDTDYDACITCCSIDDDPDDFYDKFYHEMCKKVDVVEANGCDLTVNWCDVIENNLDKFKAFTNEHWKYTYEDDDDEFVYQWIREINYYFAGYVSEDFYETLYNFALTLK